MLTLYTICAVAGCVVLVLQFLMMLIGAGGNTDFESIDDVDTMEDARYGSTWFFGVLSFKSLVAALAFFGLTGGFVEALGASAVLSFLAALSGGVIAMVVMAWLMRLHVSLRDNGAAQIRNAVGMPAQVYLSIPAARCGLGKVTVIVQNRSMEYGAVTAGDGLTTGANVIITGVIDENTVEVVKDTLDAAS